MSVNKSGFGPNDSKRNRIRVNGGIRAETVRLIGVDANVVGIVSLREALDMAREAGMDLVEISPGSDPPVCKMLDYGKFKYDEQKRLNQIKKKQRSVVVKEVKFRPSIEKGDYEVKLRRIMSFIEEGFKVKILMRFRGREVVHKDKGLEFMQKMVEVLEDVAALDGKIGTEGYTIVMFLTPKSGS